MFSWWRDDDESDDEPEEDESVEERPYPVETERYSEGYTDVLENTFTRNVVVLMLSDGRSMMIEYDNTYDGGDMTKYNVYTDVHDRAGFYRIGIVPGSEETLVSVNHDNVVYRKDVGSYAVKIERPAKIHYDATMIVGVDDIPEDCMMNGTPKFRSTPRYSDDDNYVVPTGGKMQFDEPRGWRRIDGERRFVINERYTFASWDGDLYTEPTSIPDDIVSNITEHINEGRSNVVTFDGMDERI